MEISKKEYEYLLFAVMVALTLFRFSYLGLKYTPYLDDYIQYSYYPQLQNKWQRVYWGGAGVLFTRPLAGLFDLLIWSRFWNSLGLAVGIISVLHGLSAVFFYKAFNMCGLRVGNLFLVFYILMPVNCEATYWLSAASRIVVSMFFVSLMTYFCADKRLFLFSVFNLISIWFYEQTAVLSLALAIWVCLRQNKKWWIAVPVISAFFLAVFYLKFGILGDNAHRILQVNLGAFWQNIVLTLNNFLNILLGVQFTLLTRGFARGFAKIALDFSLLWLVCLTVLSIMFFAISQKCENQKIKVYDIAWGLFFLLVPLMPFFLLGEKGFNLRNMAPCILGLAVALDRAASSIGKKYICVLGAILVFWFSVVSVSEVTDYSQVANQNFKLATQIAQSVKSDTETVRVKVATPKYYPQNAPYRDHIISMTDSDWGMTGIVRAVSGNEKVVVENIN